MHAHLHPRRLRLEEEVAYLLIAPVADTSLRGAGWRLGRERLLHPGRVRSERAVQEPVAADGPITECPHPIDLGRREIGTNDEGQGLHRLGEDVERVPPSPLDHEHLVHRRNALAVGEARGGSHRFDLFLTREVVLEPVVRAACRLLAQVPRRLPALVQVDALWIAQIQLAQERARHDARVHVRSGEHRRPFAHRAVEIVAGHGTVQRVLEVPAEQDGSPTRALRTERVEDLVDLTHPTEVHAARVDPGGG